MTTCFDLHSLRGQFAPEFADWEASLTTRDAARARNARKGILARARTSLRQGDALEPGVYVFVNRNQQVMEAVKYIGIALTSKRPMAIRMVDRLRDDSALDTNLDGLPADQFRARVESRLRLVLGDPGANYVEKHLAVAELFRASTDAVLTPWSANKATIEGAERALIASAYQLGAPLFNKKQINTRVEDLLDQVELPQSFRNRYPHELSGGQRQRIGIARALALSPKLLVADEPTSALDVSVQARVLELLQEIQARLQFACLFVSHDLAVVDLLADRIVVMNHGKIVEQGNKEDILRNPQEAYTQRLIAAVPLPDPAAQKLRREQRAAS